jgi:MSHA biogenesis protein MshQ
MQLPGMSWRFPGGRALLLGGLLLLPQTLLAAVYSLPNGSLPPTCSKGSGDVVNCGAVTLNNNDVINVTVATVMNVSSFTANYTNSQAFVNQGGAAANLQIKATGNISINQNAHINAVLSGVNVSVNQNSFIGGSITATGTVATTGNNVQFGGSITAGGTVTLHQGSSVNGTVTSTGGGLTAQNNVSITGAVTTASGVSMGANNSIGGALYVANGDVSFASGSVGGAVTVVNGAFTMPTNNGIAIAGPLTARGNITLGNNSSVNGSVQSITGSVTTNNDVQIAGHLQAVTGATLGLRTRVNGELQVTNGGVTTSNQVVITGGISATGNISLGFQSDIAGNVVTTGGGVTAANEVDVGGSVVAPGDINLGFRSHIEGSVISDGGVTTQNEVYIGGNVEADTFVDLNWQTQVIGNINSKGPVDNSGSVGGYVNAPVIGGGGSVAGPTCDQNSNEGPCYGGGGAPLVQFYRILHGGSTASCEPATVEVQACADAACSALSQLTGTVELRATGPVTVLGTLGFSASGSATTTLSLPQAESYTLSLENATVPAVGATQCPGSSGCVLDSVQASFLWQPVANQSAGVPFNVQLEAAGCAAAIRDQTLTVQLSVVCVDPGSCSAGGSLMRADSVTLAEAPLSAAVALDFDASSQAFFQANYDDAGSVRLQAVATLPGGASISGSSNAFVVKPGTIGFEFSNTETYAGDVFARAGDDFTVTLSARSLSAGQPLTPNFGKESSPAVLELQGLAQAAVPAGGVDGPVFMLDNFVRIADGRFRSARVRFGEAGMARFNAHIQGSDYLGAGDLNVQSAPQGRFIPWSFQVGYGLVLPACSAPFPGFSYMGQEFSVAFNVSALARYGDDSLNPTLNYEGSAAPATAELVAADIDSAAYTSLGARLQPGSLPLGWAQGTASIYATPVVLERLPDDEPDGPYQQLQLGVRISDNESGGPYIPLANADFSQDEADCADSDSCDAVAIDSPRQLVFGRMVLADTYGPDTGPAPGALAAGVNAQIQYWDGSQFRRYRNDSCTVISSASGLSIIEAESDALATQPGGSGLPARFVEGVNPVGSLFWTAPGEPGQIRFRYDAPEWLRFKTDQNPDGRPGAGAQFGHSGGHDRIIIWQPLPP